MSGQWKTVKVFISSTFRDMHAERDWLVRFVFSRLREELLQRRIHLVNVDLRWGVTSEQDASEVCREIITECRPRFICMLGGRYGWVPTGKTRSITAEEVHYGVLDRTLKDRGFAYFYFRDDAATAAMVETTPGEFREPQGSDNQNKLAELKRAIKDDGLNPFIYPAQWDNESKRLTGLKKFGDRVYEDLLTSMKSDPELRDRFVSDTAAQIDEFGEESAAMETFIEERNERFVLGSRETVLKELLTHARDTGGNGYVCLTGAPGSGKSALLAHLSEYLELNSGSSTIIIRHFVGASPGSTDVRRTLRRFCHELKTGCSEITAEIPDDPDKLRVAFPDFLRQACAKKHIVILLDAVNQFDAALHSAGLHWLPEELPANARIILSALDGPALEELRRRRNPPKEVELKPLTAADGDAIITQFLDRYKRTMTYKQRTALRAKADAGTPLYLLAALEELRTLSISRQVADSSDQDQAVLGLIVQLPPTTHELFAWILERLENDDGFRGESEQHVGHELVSRFAALLGASRYGLSQRELADLLDAGDPQGNVAALLHLLRPYLMRRGELLDFYHGQFRLAVEQSYLIKEEQRYAAHAQLASYFEAQDYFLESLEEQRIRARRLPPTPRPANRRKAEELVYQRLRVLNTAPAATLEYDQACEALERLLTTPSFLEAKTEGGLVFELARDFSDIIGALPERQLRHRILRLLEEALRRDIHFVARHPTTLFQCLWNLCWWYDCPKANGQYVEPEEGWRESPPWDRPSPRLSELLSDWRQLRESYQVSLPWLCSLRPPPEHLGSGQKAVLHGHQHQVMSAVFSPDSQRIASGSADKTVRIWDISNGKELRCLVGHAGEVNSVSYSPDGRRIASGSRDGIVRLWDTQTGVLLRVLSGHKDSVESVVFSPDGERIASGSGKLFDAEDCTIRLWSATTGEQIHILLGHEKGITCVAFSPDGRQIASGSRDGTTRLWDVERGEELRVFPRLIRGVLAICWSPDGKQIISGSGDSCVRVWDAATGEESQVLRGHKENVTSVAYSPDGRWIASGSVDATVRLWAARTGEETRVFRGHEHQVHCVAFSPDGRWITSGSADGTIRLWSVEVAEEPRFLKDSTRSVKGVSWSPDGRWVASGSWDKRIHIWDAETCLEIRALSGHTQFVTSVAFSPDGKRILSASADNTVRLWDFATGEQIHILRGHERIVDCIAFSPDGQRIASGTGIHNQPHYCTIRVWNATTGEELQVLRGHKDAITSVHFSPDGRQIASGSYDRTVRIWDAATGVELRVLRGHKNVITGVQFLPNGERLVVGYWDETVGIWDIATNECVEVIHDSGDVCALAAGEARLPFLVVFRGVGRREEMTIKQARTGMPVVWFPTYLNDVAVHPSGRIWAGALGAYLVLLKLEGD